MLKISKNIYYTVTINITDGTTPVSGINVTIGQYKVISDINGKCIFELVASNYRYYINSQETGIINVNGDLSYDFVVIPDVPPGPSIIEDYFTALLYDGYYKLFLIRLGDLAIRETSKLNPPSYLFGTGDGYAYNVAHMVNNNIYFASMRDPDGYYKSENLGVSYTKKYIPSGIYPLQAQPSLDEQHIIFISRSTNGVWVSNDYGATFTNRHNASSIYWDCGISQSGQKMIFVDEYYIYISNDYGATFTRKTGGYVSSLVRGCEITWNNDTAYFVTDTGLHKYDFVTDTITELISGIYRFANVIMGSSRTGILLTGAYDGQYISYDTNTDTYSIGDIGGERAYGASLSWDGKVQILTGNNATFISTDYGTTFNSFNPSNFNTF